MWLLIFPCLLWETLCYYVLFIFYFVNIFVQVEKVISLNEYPKIKIILFVFLSILFCWCLLFLMVYSCLNIYNQSLPPYWQTTLSVCLPTFCCHCHSPIIFLATSIIKLKEAPFVVWSHFCSVWTKVEWLQQYKQHKVPLLSSKKRKLEDLKMVT